MRVSILGIGYVGSVSAACLARDGHWVIGVDIKPEKVEAINAGHSPVIEPGLDDLVEQAVHAGRLAARLDVHSAIQDTDISLVCVGTPSNGNGSLDLRHIEHVCRDVGRALHAKPGYHVVVVRSTVLPGTVEMRLIPILEEYSGLQAGVDFGVCMNPEFLREGSAIQDFEQPSHVVIGELNRESGDVVQELYSTVTAPVVRTSIAVAETVKYANNAFHALKTAFANEVGNLCKVHGIDGQYVMELLCQDRQLNISPAYLRPGFAFGGSCLPKDLRALVYRAKERDVEVPLLNAILASNQRQIQRGIELVEMNGCKKVGVLGLSFKPGTDDVRESPVIPLIETLVGRGYTVMIYDETVALHRLTGANKSFLERELPHIASLMRSSIDEIVDQAEVVVVTHDSPALRQVVGLLHEGQRLIDLVGFTRGHPETRGSYEGICW